MTCAGDEHGFSLLELLVVLVIVSLLAGSGLVMLEAVHEQSRRSEQQDQFRDMRAALYGFAMSRGRLPCPDANRPADGRESRRSDGGCVTPAGTWPWATLGLARADAWGYPLHYRVDPRFAEEPPVSGASFGFADSGHIRVLDEDGVTLASGLPAVVVSWGRSGSYIHTETGPTCPDDRGLSVQEQENCNNSRDFVMAGYRDSNAPEGPFRHMLAWPSLLVLKNRMVDAGRLP